MIALFYTHQRPKMYWATGSLILFLLLPISLLDMLLAPKWHAPHWQCDSMGLPMMQTMMALPFWAVLSIGVSGLAAYLCAKSRSGGDYVFSVGKPRTILGYSVSFVVVLMTMLLCWGVAKGIWLSIVPTSFVADCGGRADPIHVTMRRPVVQIQPMLEIALAFWLLHMRTLALAQRL